MGHTNLLSKVNNCTNLITAPGQPQATEIAVYTALLYENETKRNPSHEAVTHTSLMIVTVMTMLTQLWKIYIWSLMTDDVSLNKKFDNLFKRDGPTDRPMDQQTNGQTHWLGPLVCQFYTYFTISLFFRSTRNPVLLFTWFEHKMGKVLGTRLFYGAIILLSSKIERK